MSDDDLAELCHQLDSLVIDVFTTFGQLLAARSQLELLLKDGFISMAKARYSMGGSTTVSALQYCMEDLDQAFVHIDVGTRGVVNDTASEYCFSTIRFNYRSQNTQSEERVNDCSPASSADDIGLGVRKRTIVRKSLGSDIETLSHSMDNDAKEEENHCESIDDDKDVHSTEEKHPRAANDSHSPVARKESKDPLRWFGVLVPQSLRSSQASFVRAVELTCTIATLQSKLDSLRVQYRENARQKYTMKRLVSARCRTSTEFKTSEMMQLNDAGSSMSKLLDVPVSDAIHGQHATGNT